MDIALKLKRAVATAAAGAIFVSTAGVALAQTFLDVSPDAWYYDYVEQLVDDGVIDVADNYRPADALNRAELVKIAITAIDGLAGYEAPATPTFDDVSPDVWYFDFVEAAVQLGIVNGYTDAGGNLTGFFGPGDTVNRAQATKILVNTFSVPTDLDPGSIFPDVPSGTWFHDYVVTAYNQSVLDGYDNGFFGPADPVTRAQVAKLVVNAQNPVERTAGEGEGEGEGELPTSNGDLEVSLNDNTPASSTLPLAANGVALASFDFTADQDDVQVTSLVVTRGGVGKSEDWEDLYVYQGSNRLTTGRTINSDTNTATFPLKDVVVAAGTTTTLTIVGDVSATAGASSQHYFYVASAANVSSNAQSVAGDFPVAGNTFTMGGSNTIVNSVLVEKGTAPSKVTLGEQDAEIASIKIEAGAEDDVALHQLALTNGGSQDSSDMENCRLLRGTDEVATAEGFMGDILTFTLDTPYVIDEGQTKTFYVNCDIVGGRTTDNIILYLDEDTDIIAIDQQYGFGAQVDNQFTQALANTVLLEGGDVTVVDNGPAATQVAQDDNNIELLNFSITAARDLSVRDTYLQVDVQHPSGAGGPTLPATGVGTADSGTPGDTSSMCVNFTTAPTVGDTIRVQAASGTVHAMVDTITAGACGTAGTHTVTTTLPAGDAVTASSAVTEIDPYTFVEDLKLVDLDSGNTLVGPETTVSSLDTIIPGPPTSYAELLGEDYELTGGETRHLSVQVDLNQEMPSGYQIRAQVQYPAGSIKDIEANEFVDVADIIGAGNSPLAGDFMIVAENQLNVARASTPPSNDFVKGDSDVPTLGISFGAGDAGDIFVKRLDVRLYADSNGNFADNAGVGAVSAFDTLQNVTVTASAAGTAANGNTVTVIDAGDTDTCAVTAGTGTGAVTVSCDDGTTGGTPATTAQLQAAVDPEALFIATGGDGTAVTVGVATLAGGTDGAAIAPLGDLAANTLVSSVSLYDGNDLVAGPESVDLVNAGGGLGFDAGSDYYVANFDSLDMQVPAGATKTLTVKVNLLNTVPTAGNTVYLAADVNPATDIIAEDSDADTIVPNGAALNAASPKDPQITIQSNGQLTATSEGNPDADILLTGTSQQLVAKYKFQAIDEDFLIKKLTVINDDNVDGQFNTPTSTSAVSNVTLEYQDQNGATKTNTVALDGSGVAKFAGLTFFAPAGEDAFVSIYANVASKASVGPIISGQKIRLGIQDTGNDITFFEAIGQSSSTNLNFDDTGGVNGSTSKITGEDSVDQFVIRKVKPVFTQNAVADKKLTNTTMELFDFTVNVDGSGSVDLARMVFDVTSTGPALDNFVLNRDGSPVPSTDVDIYDDTGTELQAGTFGGSQVIVSLLVPDAITGSAKFELEADVSGVVANDTVTTTLNDSDELQEISILTDVFANTNTGRVLSTSGAEGIFTSAAGLQNNIAQNVVSDSFIWSDSSAEPHNYPTVTAGVPQLDTGSFDWTNGYLLDINELDPVTLSENL